MKALLSKLPRFTYRLPRRWLLILLFIAAALIWSAVIAIPEKQLEVSFLDVGQGDAIYIQTPSRQQILIDGGPDPDKIFVALGDRLPFWDKSLDLVVLTHPDEDHIAGLVEVLSRYEVKRVLETGFVQDTPAYQEWLRLIDEKNIERTIARAGQQIELGDGIIMEVLHPQAEPMDGTESDTNNNSVVIRLVRDDISFLFTGDMGEEAEREILYNGGYSLTSTVLKVAHHGSDTSTSPHFLAAINPQLAVISAGEDNLFGHPDEDTLARLQEKVDEDKIYLTSEDGTIKITTDGEKLWVEVGE
ncbi:ComEC/Rec2 family competence protein [Chloroflexota bacterium]